MNSHLKIIALALLASLCSCCQNGTVKTQESTLEEIAIKVAKFEVESFGDSYGIALVIDGEKVLFSPKEGLWSFSNKWANKWAANWQYVKATEYKKISDTKFILSGKKTIAEGEWRFRDSYFVQDGRVKCTRRYEWHGEKAYKHKLTFANRWQVASSETQAFLPGVIYYGNPSGVKNTPNNVPTFTSKPKEFGLFEEHRYPMPFACYEWTDNNIHYGAAVHTIPSPVPFGNLDDQWWSLGLTANDRGDELVSMSGPCGYNNKRSIVKAKQKGHVDYNNTWINIKDNDAIIEKTYFLEAFTVADQGSTFQVPLRTSLDIFKPFYANVFPEYAKK